MFMYEKYLRDIFQRVKKDFQRKNPVGVHSDMPRLAKRQLSGK